MKGRGSLVSCPQQSGYRPANISFSIGEATGESSGRTDQGPYEEDVPFDGSSPVCPAHAGEPSPTRKAR